MSQKAGTTMTFLMIALSVNFLNFVDANAFVKANPRFLAKEQRITEEDVQEGLLEEVERGLGAGAASSRAKQIEAALRPIYAALPKNEKGFLGHATVRYALHRLFVQRHGWVIKGLDTAGEHRNSTSTAGLLKEQVPTYIQDLFEKRLGSRGLGLSEVAILGATIEHLIHNEAIKRVGDTFKVHDLLPTSLLNLSSADDVLATYMLAYVLNEDLTKMSFNDSLNLKAEMPDIYLAWNETKEFVYDIRREVFKTDASAQQKATGEYDFSLVARVAERVSEKFGSFQHRECEDMKATLLKIEEKEGTGRVRLADFYKPAIVHGEANGGWQFQESEAYLRQLGALDESDPDRPRVIIVNYINSPTNCLASSSFYCVCCIDECEGLLGKLEQEIVAAEATPSRVASMVAKLTSSTVTAPRTLSPTLLNRLDTIAAEHGGVIPLHGRLFAQWMHHAFPRECPYPHISGTTTPMSPDEWDALNTGVDTQATTDEMTAHVDKATSLKANAIEGEQIVDLPWAHEEELLVVRPPQQQKTGGGSLLTNIRNVVLFMAMSSAAYGLVHSALPASKAGGFVGTEKLLV